MTRLPLLFIYLRLALGLILVPLSLVQVENYKFIAVLFLTTGLLTDIFDGIIARKLRVSTQKLRRLDSSVDQVFFLSVILATYIQCPDFFRANYLKLALLTGLEAVTYLVSFLKFRKEIATHSLGAKIWTLFLFATLLQVILQCRSGLLFEFCFWIGLVTRLEIMSIILILKEWTNDIPTLYHALRLRQGKEITRNKMFNG